MRNPSYSVAAVIVVAAFAACSGEGNDSGDGVTGGTGALSEGTSGAGGTTPSEGTTGGGGPAATGGTDDAGGTGGTTGPSTTPTGGQSAGGSATGGQSTGGQSIGGSETGGESTGGNATGGGGGDPDPTELELFSFFVISLSAIQDAGGSEGLGGNLGGLYGADALCQQAAEGVGSTGKTWVAFLSVSDDGNGNPLDAIERIGSGPWHGRNGLLLAEGVSGLLQVRPDGSNETVWEEGFNSWGFKDCLTDEFGVCVHDYGDSHDTLTGSNAEGRLYGTDAGYTCDNWTSTGNGTPIIGHSWPRQGPGEVSDNANWLCSMDGNRPHTPQSCGVNINIGSGMESGVGGSGGYGAFYCFAVMNP